MRAREIAETLLNGNISDARTAMLRGRGDYVPGAMCRVLDVVEELRPMLAWAGDAPTEYDEWAMAIEKVRRCLNGGT